MQSQWLGPLVGALIVGVFAWFIRASLKRKKGLQEIAPRLGMKYIGRDQELPESGVSRLPMFSKGEMRCENVLRGRVRGGECFLFDYTRVKRKAGGKRSSYAKGTYACFRVNGRSLPAFRVRPASHGAKGTHLEFPENPAFQEKFIVTGDDQAAVKTLISGDFMDHMVRHAGESGVIEGEGEWVGMAKRPAASMHRHVKPENMRSYRDELVEILKKLLHEG